MKLQSVSENVGDRNVPTATSKREEESINSVAAAVTAMK
jgi:hypothetical protein